MLLQTSHFHGGHESLLSVLFDVSATHRGIASASLSGLTGCWLYCRRVQVLRRVDRQIECVSENREIGARPQAFFESFF